MRQWSPPGNDNSGMSMTVRPLYPAFSWLTVSIRLRGAGITDDGQFDNGVHGQGNIQFLQLEQMIDHFMVMQLFHLFAVVANRDDGERLVMTGGTVAGDKSIERLDF